MTIGKLSIGEMRIHCDVAARRGHVIDMRDVRSGIENLLIPYFAQNNMAIGEITVEFVFEAPKE